jgi:hypothetical protein
MNSFSFLHEAEIEVILSEMCLTEEFRHVHNAKQETHLYVMF